MLITKKKASVWARNTENFNLFTKVDEVILFGLKKKKKEKLIALNAGFLPFSMLSSFESTAIINKIL